MARRLLFNAFSMNCVSHIQHGHVDARRHAPAGVHQLDPWVELARLLERGCFDALFLADVVGVYDVYRGEPGDLGASRRMQIPVNDPMLLIPAMAHATEHLGFAFTSSVLQTHPFTFARQVSTLDHLTQGRVAWNIVTSYLPNAGRQPRLRRPPRPRRALRPGRGVPRGRLQAVGGQLGRRRRGGGPAPRHVRGSGQGPRHPPCRAASTTSPDHTCPSLHPSARRCCSRPARRTGGEISPPRHAECVFVVAVRRGRSLGRGSVADIRSRAAAGPPARRPEVLRGHLPHRRRHRGGGTAQGGRVPGVAQRRGGPGPHERQRRGRPRRIDPDQPLEPSSPTPCRASSRRSSSPRRTRTGRSAT